MASLLDWGKKKLQEAINGQPRPVQTISPQAQADIRTAKYGVLANNRQAQDRFINQGNVRPNPSIARQLPGAIKTAVPKVVRATDLAARRTAVDIGQAGSGLYDLASPGTGTNRFSKQLDRTARNIDATAKREGVNPAYRIMQAPLNVAMFATPGGAAKLAAKAPQLAKTVKAVRTVTRSVNTVVNKSAAKLATKGAGGRIAAQAIKTGATPAMAVNAAAGTGYDLGLESGKGRDISKRDVAISAGANIGLPFALGAGTQGAIEVARSGAKGAQATAAARRAALARQSEDDAARAMTRTLERERAAIDKRINSLPPTPDSARAVNTLLMRRDRIDNQLGAVQGAQRTRTQAVTDKVLTAQPGMSMRAVHDSNLSPEQNNFIEQYAEMLKDMGQGNGVDIAPDGRRLSNNYRAPGMGSDRQTNANWFDQARKELESGKGAYGASDEYRALPSAKKPTDTVPSTTPVPLSPDAAVPPQPLPAKETSVVSSQGNGTPQALPTRNTKLVPNRDKMWRSTRSVIERQGESGKQLAGLLQKSRDDQELWLAGIEKQMPTLISIARKERNRITKGGDFENFVNATQGLEAPKNPRVAKAVDEWKATHPSIRDRATAAGLDVGDLGDTYYPHFIDYDRIFKDTNTYNKAINHLVETGQAESQEAAIKLLNYARDTSRNRQFGNLEASRTVDLPFYDKTPNSLTSYLSGSTKRVANTENFGMKDEQALKLITKAGSEGYDTEAMKNAFDVAVGAKQYNPNTDKFSRNIRKYVTTTRLGLGALTNVSQSVNTGIVTGHLRTMGAMVKQLNPKQREFVQDSGVISEALLNDLRSGQGYESFSGKVLGKAINKVTAPGFGAVEKFNRGVAATAGRDYALRLAQKGDNATLRKLGVTGEIKGKTLTEAQQIQAARKIVEKTQFKVDPQDLPGWADSPGGKLVAQFRTFSYNQGKFFSNEVLKPLAKGNVMPAARVLAALPVGYALYETRRVIDGRPEEENKGKVALESFGKIGGAGLALDIYRSLNPPNSEYIPSDRRTSMATGTLAGPAAGIAVQAGGAINDLIQRKNTPEDEERLEGKVAVGKTDEKYTDATPAARFGLSQIPVVGTPIKNRLLPYKKQAEAEQGGATTGGNSKDTKAIITAAFSTPEAKAFIKLTDAQKKQAAQTDPDSRALYDQYQAMKKGLKPSSDLRPFDLSPESAKLLDKYDRLTTKAKETIFNRQNNAEFQYERAKFEEDLKAGKLSTADRVNREAKLRKLEVGSKYPKEVREVYGLSKAKVYEVLTRHPRGQELAAQLDAYDRALLSAGTISTAKFKYGFAPSGSRGGGSSRKGGRGGSSATTKASLAAVVEAAKSGSGIQVPKTASAPSFKTKAGSAPAGYKKAPLKQYNVKRTKVSLRQLAKIR